jgi:hypothetical protein
MRRHRCSARRISWKRDYSLPFCPYPEALEAVNMALSETSHA